MITENVSGQRFGQVHLTPAIGPGNALTIARDTLGKDSPTPATPLLAVEGTSSTGIVITPGPTARRSP